MFIQSRNQDQLARELVLSLPIKVLISQVSSWRRAPLTRRWWSFSHQMCRQHNAKYQIQGDLLTFWKPARIKTIKKSQWKQSFFVKKYSICSHNRGWGVRRRRRNGKGWEGQVSTVFVFAFVFVFVFVFACVIVFHSKSTPVDFKEVKHRYW